MKHKKLSLKRRIWNKVRTRAFLIGTGQVLCGVALGLAASWFNYNYKFQSPIVPRMMNPVVEVKPIEVKPKYEKLIIEPRKKPTPWPTNKPQPTKKAMSKSEMVNASKYPEFIDHIWERESGRGKNQSGLAGTCAAKGMSNEFGFYPQGKWCFENFAKAVARIEKWREVEAKGLSDSQALCYYNGAGKVNSCAYLSYNFEGMN